MPTTPIPNDYQPHDVRVHATPKCAVLTCIYITTRAIDPAGSRGRIEFVAKVWPKSNPVAAVADLVLNAGPWSCRWSSDLGSIDHEGENLPTWQECAAYALRCVEMADKPTLTVQLAPSGLSVDDVIGALKRRAGVTS